VYKLIYFGKFCIILLNTMCSVLQYILAISHYNRALWDVHVISTRGGSSKVFLGWCWVSSQVFLCNSLGGGGRAFNWLPNNSNAEGTRSLGGSGVCPRKILKIRTLRKKGKTLGIMPYFWIWFICTPPPPCTPEHWSRLTGVSTPVHSPINPPLISTVQAIGF
jgi:hypothetical protein